MKRDLLSIRDLSREEIWDLFHFAAELKARQHHREQYAPLAGKTLAMLFLKPSTRTRISFQVGMFQLGGQAIFLNPQDIQLGRGESLKDTARILSRYVDGILVRTFAHEQVVELAQAASVPVINGLSDLLHPCQILSDMFTIWEKLGRLEGVRVGYVGDGNNIANSWLYGAARLGLDLRLGVPPGYGPDARVLRRARDEALGSGARIEVVEDPVAAVKDAEVVYTDVWVSMGQEAEAEARKAALTRYQVNRELLAAAAPGALVMHCLPAHRGEEVTAEVIDGEHSVVFDQAENRLHLQKAILVRLLG